MTLAELSLNLPIFSAMLLLIAGVLVGYAIAFPLRGDSDSVARELRALCEQNEDLESALQQQRDAYARLERRDRQRDEEWLALQASNRRMETSLKEHAQLQSSGDERSRQTIQQKDAALADLASEREHRATLEERCSAQLQALNDLQTTADDFRDLQAKYNVLREAQVQKQALLGRAEEELAKSQEAITGRDHEMRIATEEHADIAAHKLELSQKIVELETALSAQQARVEELESDHHSALDQLASEHRQRIEIEEVLEAREQDARALADEACLVEQHEHEIQQLETWLTEAKTSLAQQTDEQDKLTTRLNEQQAWTEHLQHDLDSHRRAFETIRRQRDELQSQRDDFANRLRATEEQAEAAAAELDRLAGLEPTTEGYQHQLRQQQIALETASGRLRETLLDRDTTQAQLATLQEKLEQHQRQSHAASDKQDALRRQREEILTALRREEKRHIETSKALEEQTQRLAAVSHDGDQLQSLREELSAARQQIAAREQQLEALRSHASEHDQLKTDLSALRESLEDAHRATAESGQRAREAALASEQHRTAQLCHERDQALAELRSLKVDAFRQANKHQDDGRVASPVALEHHPTRGPIYLSEPEVRDDLKRISGIASVLESRLNELGVYTYEQIMNWNQTHIDEFSKLLSFPERIARDNWVGQAADLYQEAYGKAA